MSSLVIVLAALGACAALAIAVGSFFATKHRQRPPMFGTHSHNDYEQRWPLETALREGFVSVEADVWPVAGELLVAHDRAHVVPGLTLRRLYLEPLAARVAVAGAVLPDLPEPFQLLIEIKSHPEVTYPLLEAELAKYPGLFTAYHDNVPTPAPISVVLTGAVPREVIAGQLDRLVAYDGQLQDVGSGVPISLMPLCSDNWRWHFRWRGLGPMPAAERELLHRLVAQAHADGRKIRFWGAPVWPPSARKAAWAQLRAAGVDFVGADHLVALRRWSAKRVGKN